MNTKLFRSKNSTVEAVRLTEDGNWNDAEMWCRGLPIKARDGRNCICVPVREGRSITAWHYAFCGDWILRLPDTGDFVTKTQQEMEAEYNES